MTFIYVPLADLVLNSKIKPFAKSPAQNLESLKSSIQEVGLLNPLVVIKHNSKYLVLDGKKRLEAMRQLKKSRHYMRSLQKVPCIMDYPAAKGRPLLMRAPELASAVITDVKGGQSMAAVAQKYDCKLADICEAMTFKTLHPEVLKYFNNETITWEQAAALATIANPDAQLNLLMQLGPFVSNKEIIAAVRQGQTVINLPDGNILCLPSRKVKMLPLFDIPRPTPRRLAA